MTAIDNAAAVMAHCDTGAAPKSSIPLAIKP